MDEPGTFYRPPEGISERSEQAVRSVLEAAADHLASCTCRWDYPLGSWRRFHDPECPVHRG